MNMYYSNSTYKSEYMRHSRSINRHAFTVIQYSYVIPYHLLVPGSREKYRHIKHI